MATDFKRNFFDLQGVTLMERKANFYRLLNATPKNISDDQLDFEPRDYLESLYKVEALIYFRKTPQLLEVLKEGHAVFSCKIVKERWFFEQAFCHINEEALVNDMLPQFSYSMRMKILKKVASRVNEERMDKIFDLVFERYGLFIASQFISYCSKDKIEQFCQKYPTVKLKVSQLMQFFDKDPDLVLKYWEEKPKSTDRPWMIRGKSYSNPRNMQSFYQYVAQKDPKTFIKYRQKDPTLMVRLGKRTTKGMIKQVEDDIKADIESYKSVLKLSIVLRKMKEFDQPLGIKFLSSPVSFYFPNDFKNYLKNFPHKRRWPILQETFRQVYGKDILDNLDGMPEWVINLALPHVPDVKHKWAEIQYKNTNNSMYLKYLSTDVGIPLLREKLKLSSDKSQRSNFLSCLIENCIKNKDLDALGKMLHYVCYRHRNEEPYTRQSVLSLVKESGIDLVTQLKDNHWKSINELLDIQKARNEYQFQQNYDLRFKYIEYLYVNNKPDKEKLTEEYVSEDIDELLYYLPAKPKKHEECIKKIYYLFAKIVNSRIKVENLQSVKQRFLDKIISFNENSQHKVSAPELEIYKEIDFSQDLSFLKSLISYNEQNPVVKFKIPEGEDLLRYLFDTLQNLHQDGSSKYHELIIWLVKKVQKTKRTEMENIILGAIFNEHLTKKNGFQFTKLFKYFLKNDPLVIVYYYQQIANAIDLDFSWFDFDKYYIKKYSYLGLPQKIIALANERLPSTSADDQIHFYRLLSILMSSKDFAKSIEHLLPNQIKLDTNDPIQMEKYELQCEVAELLKNVLQPSEVNDITLKFFQGDYLQSTLTSLYKINYRLPETMVAKNMADLATRAVSARKHAIYLACEILPVKTVEEVFSRTLTTELNTSNLKNSITSLLKYFSKNHIERLFDLLLNSLDRINENDKELLDFITNVEIPKKYQPIFIERSWKALEALKQKQVVISMEPYQKNVLINMKLEILANFNPDFIKSIIKTYFLRNESFCWIMNEMALNYLKLYPNDEQFEFIFKTIKKWKMESSQSVAKHKVFNIIDEFFSHFYPNLYKIESINFTLLFKKHWEKVFSDVQFFKQHLALQIMVLYKQDNQLVKFAQNFIRMTKELHKTYGYGVQELINEALKFFKTSVVDFNLEEFISILLNAEISDTTISVAFFLLPFLKDSQNIVKVLEGVDHPFVKIKLATIH